MQIMNMDIVVQCPMCGDRIPLPPLYVIPQLVREPNFTYLTASINDVGRVHHECGTRIEATGSMKVSTPPQEAGSGYPNGMETSSGRDGDVKMRVEHGY